MSSGGKCTCSGSRPGTSCRSNGPADPATGHSLGSSIELVRICVPLSFANLSREGRSPTAAYTFRLTMARRTSGTMNRLAVLAQPLLEVFAVDDAENQYNTVCIHD